MQLLKFLICR